MNKIGNVPSWFISDDVLQEGEQKIENIGTLDGKMVIQCTHDHLVEIWKDSFYNLGVIKEGYCYPCCKDTEILHVPKEVIVQVGAFQAGVKVGFCVQCIFSYMQQKTPHHLVIHLPFQTSADTHIVRITPKGLRELVERESGKTSTIEAELSISETMKDSIKPILSEFQSQFEQMDKEEKRVYQCKICCKIDLRYFDLNSFKWINSVRKTNSIMAPCLGCSAPYSLKSGCSVMHCTKCLSGTRTCGICVDGVTGMKHEVAVCTKIMYAILNKSDLTVSLPEMQECKGH